MVAWLSASILLLIFAAPAQAYVDPGTGSLVLQIILSGFTGLFLFFRISMKHGLGKLKRILFKSQRSE